MIGLASIKVEEVVQFEFKDGPDNEVGVWHFVQCFLFHLTEE